MKDVLRKKCDLLVENTRIMKKNFFREYSLMKYLCANIYTNENIEVATDKIKECNKLLKKRKDLSKDFKGIVRIVIATLLSFEKEPDKKLDEVVNIYSELRKCFDESKHLPLVALLLSDMEDIKDYSKVASDAKDLYDDMKIKHPLITSNEDSGFCALLAVSGVSSDLAIDQMEKIYSLLKNNLRGDNAIQSISHVLTLGNGSVDAKYCKTMAVVDELKKRKCNFTDRMEQVMVAFLALIKEDPEVIADEVSEVYEYLKTCKGYASAFTITRSQRLMYSCCIVADSYLDLFAKKSKSEKALDVKKGMNVDLILRQIMTATTLSACLDAGSSSDYE